MAIYKPYSLRTPNFELLSGGIRVMYGLFGWLLAKGQVAYLNAKYSTSDFIGVYPEIYWGNDMGADTVVKYILNKPGVMSSFGMPGPSIFPPEDHIFGFTKLYDTYDLDEDHLMFLPILNLHLFKDQKKKRKNRCVFVGKGRDMPLKKTEGLKRITIKMSMDQGALADYLNTCEVMYSFENPTAMNEIARLCGCRVIFLPDEVVRYTKKDLEEKYEPGMNGIGWGKDTTFDVSAFRSHYIALQTRFSDQLDKFIEITQA